MSDASQRLGMVRGAVLALSTGHLGQQTAALLKVLGYDSPKTLGLDGTPAALLDALGIERGKFDGFGGAGAWRSLHLVFQLTADELPALARGSVPSTTPGYQRREVNSFVFLALDLHDRDWTRRELVGITRELNRGLDMPAIVLFRYGAHATFAVIDRRPNQRDPTRDVVGGRISLVKDIGLHAPHRAHVEILAGLALPALRPAPTTFRALYDTWLQVLSASALNKRFYKELADWFAWASGEGVAAFPPGQGNGEGERQTALIRLLTRLMFVWFIKQKDLVPSELFDRDFLQFHLVEPPHDHLDGDGYYLAVLQNLFFACLNTEMDGRTWRHRKPSGGTDGYMVHKDLRHRAMFTDPDAALQQFARVPFLNGGLFECLDVTITPNDRRAPRASREGRSLVLRVDGFSDEAARQPRLPNRLFFGGQADANLSAYYGRPTRRTVPGLLDLFGAYKFTVEENTPLEEEAALDPELLGKVFENLLASYNEDTRTTARNNSGSFYTQREVVDFMVDEALVAYLAPKLPAPPPAGLRPARPRLDFGAAPGELTLAPATSAPVVSAPAGDSREAQVRALLSYASTAPTFGEDDAGTLVTAIEQCRAIDPAVGSGAFPLGLLQKLVHVLGRLDPEGTKWQQRNRLSLERDLANAQQTPSPADRAERIRAAEARLAAFDASFQGHAADYARKLYLIEGCLFGVDIQPIAVQIAKLRCFIALAVEQRVDNSLPNRGVLPLPNLELKFVAANALRQVAAGQFQLRDERIIKLEQERRDASAAFFSARKRKDKQDAAGRITETRKALGALLAGSGFPADDALAMAQWDPFDANAAAPFFDPEWMFGLEQRGGGYFHLVLANPPYVRQEKIEGFLLDGRPANTKAQLSTTYPEVSSGQADLYVYFYARSAGLLKSGGVVAFITSNKWFRAGYGAKLRGWLGRTMRLRSVLDFGDAPVFDAIAYPAIVVAQKEAGAGSAFHALNWEPDAPPDGFPARFAADAFAVPQASLSGTGWQLERQTGRDLLARLRAGGQPLGDWCNGRFYYGIKTGLNKAFVIDGVKRADLIAAHASSAEIIKPFLRGQDVKRWSVQPADKWLIFTRHGTTIDQYPAIKAHLAPFRSQLEPKPVGWDDAARWPGRKAGSYRWFEIQDNVAYWAEFEQPKIIYPDIYEHQSFALDDRGFYGANTCYFIPTTRRWVMGLLNSTLMEWFYTQVSSRVQGGYMRAFSAVMQQLPIPSPTLDQEALITIAVDAILAGAQPRALLEALLNAFVYELFFPTEVAAAGSPFAAARGAGLHTLSSRTSPALAAAANEWARTLSDPASPLGRALYNLQSLESVRIIEGRT